MTTPAHGPVPDKMTSLTTYLFFNGDCQTAIEYYQTIFGAEPIGHPVFCPDGKTVIHMMLKVGNACLMLADTQPGSWEKGPEEFATAGLWMYVPDCDSLFEKAVDGGCEVLLSLTDAFWGDRFGKVKDPFGHCWSIATHKFDISHDELEQAREKWIQSMKSENE
ncbi:VOC family protein [Algicola sagamiensis]|uniref:VOC family protein n=1 Tax=Algicola sagamiensis TaxID=163869 RepID=UPI00036DEE73|nr:VOC family protein [Algicola sagamiensis]